MNHEPVPSQRRLPLRQVEEAKAMLQESRARTKLRHAAITQTLGSYDKYASWAKGMRARWK